MVNEFRNRSNRAALRAEIRQLEDRLAELRYQEQVEAFREASAAANVAAPASAEPLATRQQLATALSVSLATVNRLLQDGVPHVRIGDSPRFDLAAVRAWLEARSKEEKPAASPVPAKVERSAGVRLLSRKAVAR